MTCPQCQKPMGNAARVCPNCGHDVASVPTVQASVPFDPFINLVLDNKYELLALLGRGGMGSVYRARRTRFESEDVAIKVLHQTVTDAETRKRFQREASAAAKLSRHPNIVVIMDFEEGKGDQPLAYIVMELLEGDPLSEILKKEHQLEPVRAISLMSDICDGVNFAHQQGVTHRDLKPQNIVILPARAGRKGETVKIVDFGLAKIRPTDSLTDSLTPAGTRLGTPLYMSPEACRGEKLDARSDIYSLGATMYHMLSGRPPFMAGSILQLQWQHVNEKPPSLPNNGKMPAGLDIVVMRALEKDPEKRPQDAATFAHELQQAMKSSGELVSAPTPPLSEFTFRVPRVSASGEVVRQQVQTARFFSEPIDWETVEMVEIPGGDFMMGSPVHETGHRRDEEPQRRVHVPAFFLGKYEITQAQWRAVASFEKETRDLDPFPANVRGDKRPVEGVSWYDALEFCARLSRKTGREYRLPSEAEWEYACRGGLSDPFCFGENINWELVNHNGNFPYPGSSKGHFRSTTTDVGSAGSANNFGLFDMLGNVWEWCQDAYVRNYHGAPLDGTARLGNDGLPRVVRGGSWRAPAVDCASAARNSSAPQTCGDDIGFRVVCSGLAAKRDEEIVPVPTPSPSRVRQALANIRVMLNSPGRKSAPVVVIQDLPRSTSTFFSLVLIHMLVALISIDVFLVAIFPNWLGPIVWGITLGVCQARLLRRYLQTPGRWVLVTVAGAFLAGLIHRSSGLSWEISFGQVWRLVNTEQIKMVASISLRWLLVGVGQWFVLRKVMSAAWVWPTATLGAALGISLIVIAFARDMNDRHFFMMFIGVAGLFLATAQTVCLIYLGRKQRL